MPMLLGYLEGSKANERIGQERDLVAADVKHPKISEFAQVFGQALDEGVGYGELRQGLEVDQVARDGRQAVSVPPVQRRLFVPDEKTPETGKSAEDHRNGLEAAVPGIEIVETSQPAGRQPEALNAVVVEEVAGDVQLSKPDELDRHPPRQREQVVLRQVKRYDVRTFRLEPAGDPGQLVPG